jgi:hypothetical protein
LVGLLGPLLIDGVDEVVVAAIETLRVLRQRQIAPELLNLSNSASASVRLAVCSYAATLGYFTTLQILADDPNPEVSFSALGSLLALGKTEAGKDVRHLVERIESMMGRQQYTASALGIDFVCKLIVCFPAGSNNRAEWVRIFEQFGAIEFEDMPGGGFDAYNNFVNRQLIPIQIVTVEDYQQMHSDSKGLLGPYVSVDEEGSWRRLVVCPGHEAKKFEDGLMAARVQEAVVSLGDEEFQKSTAYQAGLWRRMLKATLYECQTRDIKSDRIAVNSADFACNFAIEGLRIAFAEFAYSARPISPPIGYPDERLSDYPG